MTNLFIYGLVAHDTTILTEYTTMEGNFRKIAAKILKNLDPSMPNAISEQGNYIFQTLTDKDNTTFLCLTDKKAISSLRTNFLGDLRNKWRQKFGNNCYSKSAKTQSFSTVIQSLFVTYNSERAQKLAQAKENIQIAQDQTTQNLKLALQRGEQLEVMAAKADNLRESAKTFHRESIKARGLMFWQKWKILILILIVIVILVTILFLYFFKFRSKS